MGNGEQTTLRWKAVLDATPGALAVQTGDSFVYAAEELADAVGQGVAELVGARWETVTAIAPERDGLGRRDRTPVEAARAEGSWTGPLLASTDDAAAPKPVTLTATDDGAIVWSFAERASETEDQSDAQSSDGDRSDEESTIETGTSGVATPAAREAELERAKHIIGTVLDGVYALDGDLRFTFVNDALADMFGMTKDELLGTNVTELFANQEELAIADDIRERVVAGDTSTGTVQADVETPGGKRTLESNYRLYPEPDGEYRGSVGVIRDVTARERRERALTQRRDELETLARINELLLETTRELVESASRDAVERRVCEQLASSDRYEFAWVGEQSFDGDRLVPRTAAGDGDGYLEDLTVTIDDSETGRGPGGRAVRTGEVQVANVDDAAFEPWRRAATERGFASVAAVPLQHGETVYGSLAVYAADEDAFTEHERAGFDVLGRTVGFVIHAVKSQKLLDADVVVELDFRYDGADHVPARLSESLECTLELEGYVSSGDRWVLYFGVADADPNDVVAAAKDVDDVAGATVVSDDAYRQRVELTLEESSFLDTISDAGAEVTGSSSTNGAGQVSVELPAGADVRSIAALIQRKYPTLELVAQRERERTARDTAPPGGLLAELTERQRQSLEAAYHAGYFAWPRESTAEEVARSLDLAAPTLHGHIRKAEQGLLSALFDRELDD